MANKTKRHSTSDEENAVEILVCDMMSPAKNVYDYYCSAKGERNSRNLISACSVQYRSFNTQHTEISSVFGNDGDTTKSSLMYDSDPGDLKSSRNRICEGKSLVPNRNRAIRFADYDSAKFDSKSVVTAGKSIADSITTDSNFFSSNDDGLSMDSTRIDQYVNECMNKRMSFIWHMPSKYTSEITSEKSIPALESKRISRGVLTKRVKVWIELGTVLRSQVIHPKLCWVPHETAHRWNRLRFSQKSKKHSSKDDEKASSPTIQSIDLLDVSSILEADDIDRKQYPFAMKDRTFIISTCDQKIVFEAASKNERTQTMFSFKLVISHFAAGIVAHNDETFEQFFHLNEAQVPGEAPDFLCDRALHEC